ncbi:Putative Function: the yeast gene is a positive regulator of URA1 and URA3 expression [Penicillium brasilianum]|uniref:Putative Function: the yeast gene is a positive regulator of URA1 and URA3 expression n=1 Tax=Penicillium brasilianum TaxID=104259 RepID=A0A0F7VIY1_PENBI|nr:Putative Function: the yeast gene is a positive regulator of URA1 and URA3 expression [Penicillium brasilianum]
MSESPPTSTPRRHRRGVPRSVAACQRCRRRKQKCDGKVPTCGPCAAVEVPCVMSDRLMIQHTNSNCECESLRSQLAAAEQRSHELSQKCQQLELQILEALSSTQAATDTPNSENCSVAPTTTGTVSRPDQLSSNPDNRFTSRILGPTFSLKANTRKSNRSALSSAWELWGDDTTVEVPEAGESGLDLDAYVNLVNAFFDRRWPYLPVLHRGSFFQKHLTPFLTKSDMRPLSNFLVNIVCAIASTERSSQHASDKICKVFFREAVKDLHLVMSSDNFECIQCLLLMCMYGHNEPQSVNMWYTTGLALNLAIGIDLHRKESLVGQGMMDMEMCKRVFWCAYVMSCSMAINMGRPLGIRESDISMPLPLQLTDTQLDESVHSPYVEETLIPNVADTSTFIHIIKLRRINAGVYTTFHSIGSTLADTAEIDTLRSRYFMELNQWLITAPRYMQTLSTFQSTEWFQIAFHHAVLSLYRPSRAVPMPSPDDLRVCTESSIGLISSYSALYARNHIKYTFVAIHSLFMAAVTMLYSLRAFAPLRRELTKPVIKTNIFTFLTLFRGICDGRLVGDKCCGIVERLGNSILSLFENEDQADSSIDTEFQTWFGLQTHTFDSQARDQQDPENYPHGSLSHFPDVQVDLPWADLFTEGIDMGTTDAWSVLF